LLNGEEWRAFGRRYIYPQGYVWRPSHPTGKPHIRPISTDYMAELWRRHRA
jgi:hypothetical protein